jgi:hypothetical protein
MDYRKIQSDPSSQYSAGDGIVTLSTLLASTRPSSEDLLTL